MKRALCLFGLLCLSACGPTIGDPCTTAQECGAGVCVNRDFAPGGYCSKGCAAGAGCPAGTLCVANVLNGGWGCMRTCTQAPDCRPGYVCAVVGHSAASVCIGPAGL